MFKKWHYFKIYLKGTHSTVINRRIVFHLICTLQTGYQFLHFAKK